MTGTGTHTLSVTCNGYTGTYVPVKMHTQVCTIVLNFNLLLVSYMHFRECNTFAESAIHCRDKSKACMSSLWYHASLRARHL